MVLTSISVGFADSAEIRLSFDSKDIENRSCVSRGGLRLARLSQVVVRHPRRHRPL
jgi:hypothetical protein